MQTTSIVLAQISDLPEVCGILQEACEWLAQRNMPLWDPDGFTVEKMQPLVTKQELFVARVEDKVAGTITIQDEDALFWPEVPAGDSVFFHKLAVKRQFAGIGVSSALIEFCEAIGRSRGRKFVRMDCSANHPKLKEFYESHGYICVGQRHVGSLFVNRFKKPLAE